jgi:hypothetical protein
MASFSKEVWFQCQAFPKNVLAVLWDFKGLEQVQIYFSSSPNFCGGGGRKAPPDGGKDPTAII